MSYTIEELIVSVQVPIGFFTSEFDRDAAFEKHILDTGKFALKGRRN